MQKIFSKTRKILPAILLIAVFVVGVGIPTRTTQAAIDPSAPTAVITFLKAITNPYSIVAETVASGAKAFSRGVSCVITGSGLGGCVLEAGAIVLDHAILPVVSFILVIAGGILDASIYFTLNTSFWNNSDAIYQTWTVIRDLINIAFIFILLFIAIGTILQLSSYNMRKSLASLILAVILVNFSMFITKVAVDAGNIVANGFYNALTNGDPQNHSVSGGFKNLMAIDLATVGFRGEGGVNYGINGREISSSEEGAGYFINAVGRIVVGLVAAYVFFWAAFLLIARTVLIIFLIATSPIGFIGSVVPGLGGIAGTWRKNLVNQILVAPIFLLLLYISYRICSSITQSLQNYIPDGKNIPIPFFINYAIVIVFLIAALKITKSFSGKAGDVLSGWGKMAVSFVAGAGLAVATGGLGTAGRMTLGRAAAGAAASESLKEKASQGGARGFAARMQLKAANRLADSSFDPRASKTFRTGVSKAAGFAGLAIKPKEIKTKDVNYRATVEKRAEEIENMARQIQGPRAKEEEAERQVRARELKATVERSEREESAKREKAIIAATATLPTEEAKAAKRKEMIMNAPITKEEAKAATNFRITTQTAKKQKLEEQMKKEIENMEKAGPAAGVKAVYTKNIEGIKDQIRTVDNELAKLNTGIISGETEELAKIPTAIRQAQKEMEQLSTNRTETYLKTVSEKKGMFGFMGPVAPWLPATTSAEWKSIAENTRKALQKSGKSGKRKDKILDLLKEEMKEGDTTPTATSESAPPVPPTTT